MLGKKLRGRYKIIQELGRGGFGVTYLALDEDLPGSPNRAVKHLKPKDPNPNLLPVARRLFKREAEVLYRLKHEQIPELFAHFEENGEFYLVQDYVDGDDLSKAELKPGKRLSESDVIKLLQGILEVLAFVHQHDVIHRDIKPQNVIRRRQDGKLVLIDFGAVKEIHTLVTNPQGQMSATCIGSPGYTPREQERGNPQPSSDVYAVGMIGIQALTGIDPTQLPENPNTPQVIWHHKAKVSPKLANILDKMVRYDFTQRYSAVEALQATLGLTNSLPTTVSLQPSTQLSLPKKKWLRITALIGLFGGLIAGLVFLYNQVFPSQTKPIEQIATDLSTYENIQDGIKIKYPQTWEKQENPDVITQEIVKFISPKESDSDPFREKLSIEVKNLSSPMSLDEYTNLSKKEILAINKNAKIINEESTTLAGKEGYSIVYISEDDNKLERMEVWTLKNYKAYSITYEAKADKYDKFLGTAETMIKSLQIE